jgi:hypothetical protein
MRKYIVLLSGARQFSNEEIGKHWFSAATGFEVAAGAGCAQAGAPRTKAATSAKLAQVLKGRDRIIDI